MLYSKHITVSADTAEAAAASTYFKVNKGMIYYVWLTFPPGCAGLVKLRVYHEGHPFLPVNKSDYLRGDSITFQFPIFKEILESPELIRVEAWNEDETYEHTVDLLMLVLPKKYIIPIGAYEGIIKSISDLIIRKGEEKLTEEKLKG